MKKLVFLLSIVIFSGCIGQDKEPKPEPNEKNPLTDYCKNAEISDDVCNTLSPLGEDGLQDNEKQLIGYISQLPAGLRANVAAKVMDNQTLDNYELDIVKNSLINPDITDELFGMSFMEMWDKGDLTKINFLNSVYSQNPGLAKEIMKNNILDNNYEKTLLGSYSQKTFDASTWNLIIKGLGKSVDETEATWLKNASKDPDIITLCAAYFRGKPEGTIPELDAIHNDLSKDEFIWDNVIIDLWETNKSKIFKMGTNYMIDEDGDGKFDRKYADLDPNVPGIDTIDTIGPDRKTFEWLNYPYYSSHIFKNENTKMKRFYFDAENGNGHVIKLPKYYNRIEDVWGGVRYVMHNTYAEQNGWTWIDVRDFGVVYLDIEKSYGVFIEIGDGDTNEEAEYIYTPPEEAKKRGMLAYPYHRIWYPIWYQKRVSTDSTIGMIEFEKDLIVRKELTLCKIPESGLLKVKNTKDYKKCYKKSKSFRRLADIFWSIFYKKWPQEIWEEMKPTSII